MTTETISAVTRPGFKSSDPATIAALRKAAELLEAGETDVEQAILTARGFPKPGRSEHIARRARHLMRKDTEPAITALRQYLRYLGREDSGDAALLRSIANIIEEWQGVFITTTVATV